MKAKLDKDTNKVVSESQTIYDFVKSDGWRLLKSKLISQIINLRDIRQVDTKQSKEKIAVDVIAHNKASDILYGLLSEFEGTAQAHQSLMEMAQIEDDILLNQEDVNSY